MSINKRQQIINVLEKMMSDIAVVRRVATWKIVDFAAAEYPVILIRDTVDTMPEPTTLGRIDHELDIEITGMFFGITSASDARELAASIVAAVGENPTFSGIAYDTAIQAITLNVDEFGKKISTVTIDTTVFYRSKLWTI